MGVVDVMPAIRSQRSSRSRSLVLLSSEFVGDAQAEARLTNLKTSVHAAAGYFFAILERVRLMTYVALIDLRASVPTHRTSRKMFGKMAGRGLMALRTDL